VSNQPKQGVRAPYTFAKLKNDLTSLHAKDGGQLSLREIAEIYDVSHAAIQRVLDGLEPKTIVIREKFGLPPLPVTVTPCPHCGGVHLAKRCPTCSTPRKYHAHPVTRLSRLTNRERAKREFEARYSSRLNLTVSSQDNYMNSETQTMWRCWFASRVVAAAGSVDAG
jgi:hypothetical protein